MSSAALTNFNFDVPKEKSFSSKKETYSLELYSLANKAREMAQDIEQNWSTFNEEKKELYRALAYSVTNTEPSLRRRVTFRLRTWSASDDSLMQYRFSVRVLLNIIFDKIEEESQTFQDKINQVVDEFNPDENGMLVTRGNAIERLRELSD